MFLERVLLPFLALACFWCIEKWKKRLCLLGTATLSLKFENVVPLFLVQSTEYFFYSRSVVKFLLLLHRCAVVVRTSIFRKISHVVIFV